MSKEAGAPVPREDAAALMATLMLLSGVMTFAVFWPDGFGDFRGYFAQDMSVMGAILLTFGVIGAAIWLPGAIIHGLFASRGYLFGMALATPLVGLYVFANRFYFTLFESHLDPPAFAYIWGGIRQDQFQVPPMAAMGLAAGLGAAAVVTVLLYKGLARLARMGASSTASPAAACLVPLLLAMVVGMIPRALEQEARWPFVAETMSPLGPFLLGSVVSPPPLLRLEGDAALTVSTELESARELAARRDDVLAGEVAADRLDDILIIHVEALRADVVDHEHMPLLSTRSDRCTTLQQHYSNTSHTTGGVHGLVSGLNPFYLWPSRMLELAPVPLSLLAELGYEATLYASETFSFDGVSDLFFAPDTTAYVSPEADNPGAHHEADEKVIDSYLSSLSGGAADATPRFDYLVLFSTHWDYYYPEEFERRTPATRHSVKRLLLASSADPEVTRDVRNRYLNAVGYVDALIDRVLVTLEEQGRLDRTMVVIAGDHGEAFFEKGKLTHASDFSREQVHSGTVLCFPEPIRTRYTYTSHADIMPTVFDSLGVAVPWAQLMTGKSLLDFDAEQDFVIIGPPMLGSRAIDDFVVVGDGYKVHFENRGRPEVREVTDLDDQPIEGFDAQRVRRLLRRAVQAKQIDQVAAPLTEPARL